MTVDEAEAMNARERAALADRLELEILTHPVRDWVWKVAGEKRGGKGAVTQDLRSTPARTTLVELGGPRDAQTSGGLAKTRTGGLDVVDRTALPPGARKSRLPGAR